MSSRKLLVLATLLCCVSNAIAQPAKTEKTGAKIESYISQVDKILEREQKRGAAVPSYRNEAKLPLMVFPKGFDDTERVEFRIDVSGVNKLYIGTGERATLRDIALDSGDGVKQPLRSKANKLLVKVGVTDKRKIRWQRGSSLYIQQSETLLELDGKYKWISGKIDAQRSMFWISDKSNASKLKFWTRLRNDRQSAMQRAGFDRRYDAPTLPLGFTKITIKDAVDIIQTYAIRKGGGTKNIDPKILSAINDAAKTAKTGADYDRVQGLCYAAIFSRDFKSLRQAVAAVTDVPGMIKKFDATLQKDYQLLNTSKFNYKTDFPAAKAKWEKLIKEMPLIAKYPEMIEQTLKQLGKSSPAAIATEKTAATKLLAGAAGDLDKYLAAYTTLKAKRLEAMSKLTALDFDSILINRNPPTKYSHNGDQHLGRHSRIGKGLTIISDWKSGNPKVKTILEGKMPPGAYRNPDLSYDAKRVVFAFCDHTEQNPSLRRFFIWEAAIDGSWVRQLTGTKRDKFKTWDGRATVLIEDNDPCYLPDGNIVFISSRCQSFGRCHGGRYNPAWNLHKCDKDGNNIQQLSFANENEVEPSVLNDGRIVFTRWEYTNRHEMWFHKLWWCRPDGTGVAHFFGNDMVIPHQFLEATAIPGTHKVVCTAQGHHSYNTGTTVVLDTNIGENTEDAITHITPETPYSETRGWPEPHYSHPYPLTENIFLASRANHRVHKQGQVPPVADRAIYLIDSLGGRDKIYEDPEVASFSPIPVKPRKVPPVLPSMLPENAAPYGVVALQNAYMTRKENDPNGIIKPGMIKAIRINALGVQPRASRVSCTMTVANDIPKKVLGTVPVNEDGSAVFKVPANTSLQIQTLDKNGMAILTEKSLFYLMPGERRSCVGCHEAVGTAAPMTAVAKMSRMKPVDIIPAAGPQYKGGMSFARTVQPVLDRHCIKCHGLDKTEKKVNLMYVKTGRYPDSLMEIVKRGEHRIGDKGFSGGRYKGTNVTYNISHPRRFFAWSNSVAQKLANGDKHHKKLIDIDRAGYMRIIEWLDLNGQCFGDLFPNRIEDRKFDSKGLAALRAHITKLFGAKIAAQPEYALVNVAQPDESRILLMPLPTTAGGWGQIKGFTSKDDPAYKKTAELVEACIVKNPNENINGWQPTWNMGGAETWVKEARAQYIEQLNKKQDK
ncbi:MAG: hypothetical protein HN350_01920 [Phycisphaerales bacterium]|jgi:hypothetical protein|nr:hypothetical protein [Phycisphaerales bacterium]